MRKADNLARHELIGLRLRVVRARDEGMVGMQGTVVDESREMLAVERDGGKGTAHVPKRGARFELQLEDGTTAAIDGDAIAYRPEDRTKRARGEGDVARRGPGGD
jgi:ribonuclease P protein subunit POP4